MVNFDTVIAKYIKPIGRWQWFTFIVINLTIFGNHSSFPTLSSLTPDHQCAIPQLRAAGMSATQIRKVAIPLRSTASRSANRSATEDYDSCRQFEVRDIAEKSTMRDYGNGTLRSRRINNSLILPNVIPCQNGWYYDPSTAQFRWSFPEDFNLVCHRKYFVPLANSVYFIGSILGRVFGGYLGDRFGRKPVMSISCALTCIFGFAVAFAPNVWCLIIFRLIIGACSNAATITSIVLWSEMTDDRHRNTLGFLFGIHESFVVPSCTVLAAYITQNWSYLHLCLTTLYGLSVFHPCLISESPRWLLSKGRVKAAWDVIQRAMTCNGRRKKFSAAEMSELEAALRSRYAKTGKQSEKKSKKPRVGKIVTLLTRPDLRRRLIPFLFIWTVIMGTSIGLQYYSVRMKHSNPYIVAFVGGTFTIPGLIIKQFLYHFFDRKRPLVGVFATSAAICAVGAFLRASSLQGPWDGALATIVLGCILVAQNMCYAYTAECFPTEYRSYAMGLVSGLGRVGAAFSTFIERLDQYVWSGMPLTIFAVLCLGAALTVLFVPPISMEEKEFSLTVQGDEEEESEELAAIEVLGRSLASLRPEPAEEGAKSDAESTEAGHRLVV